MLPVMTPQAAHAIVRRLACFDFPFDSTRALEFALFRTFCVPRIAALLDRTREFGRFAQKRYDDTDLLISEFVENGYDSPRGRAAIERMNAIHGHFRIANEDFLYVLSTFVYEPVRWNARFGWRRFSEDERRAMFIFWREVGQRMGIRDIPDDYDAFECFNIGYEARHFRYTDAGHRVATATREMFAAWFPRLLRPLVRGAIYAILDEPARRAAGFPAPGPVMRRLVSWGLRLRARIAGWLPTRRTPRLRTRIYRPTYPHGYRTTDLGPGYLTRNQ